jgi:predicted acetyltransferase
MLEVHLEEVTAARRQTIENLMQLYLYDFTEFLDNNVDSYGLFQYKYLNQYWNRADRVPLLIKVENMIAGFALINSHTLLEENMGARSIAEFFVMRKFRRRGIGRKAAMLVFDMFRGRWEIAEIETNRPAQSFWRSVINEYTGGDYSERQVKESDWPMSMLIQSFDNSRTQSES